MCYTSCIVMSHKWAANAYGVLSDCAMERVRAVIRSSPWIITHDNVNILMRVFSQWLHNQSHFISGCAATVWELPLDVKLSPNINHCFLQYLAKHSKAMFSYPDILNGDPQVLDCLENQYVYHILHVLLDSPVFLDYQHCYAAILQPPLPMHQLPSVPSCTIKQHILKTQDQEETSYEGNDKAILGWFCQLGISTDEEMKKTGTERFLVWVGDQLTVERLREL